MNSRSSQQKSTTFPDQVTSKEATQEYCIVSVSERKQKGKPFSSLIHAPLRVPIGKKKEVRRRQPPKKTWVRDNVLLSAVEITESKRKSSFGSFLFFGSDFFTRSCNKLYLENGGRRKKTKWKRDEAGPTIRAVYVHSWVVFTKINTFWVIASSLHFQL